MTICDPPCSICGAKPPTNEHLEQIRRIATAVLSCDAGAQITFWVDSHDGELMVHALCSSEQLADELNVCREANVPGVWFGADGKTRGE